MAQVYGDAESVSEFATNLIAQYHPELVAAKFRFVFKEKASKKGGKVTAGSVKKCSDLMKFLIDADYLIEVGLDAWNDMDANRRKACVDHLLERCEGEEDEKSGEMKYSTREPDVNEFATILQRHGVWNDDLEGFVEVAKRVDLDDDDGDDEAVDAAAVEVVATT